MHDAVKIGKKAAKKYSLVSATALLNVAMDSTKYKYTRLGKELECNVNTSTKLQFDLK